MKIALPFLTSALDGGEWSASSPDLVIPLYPLGRRLGGPLNRLDALE
jgi:hypothetical protein